MTIHADRPTRWEWLALGAILLLAAVLRLDAPGISEFKLDEAHLSKLALDMARGRDFPLLGIGSSVGIPNLPVSVWLFALPYWFSSDPTIATVYVGLLNVAAVGLTWWLARRYFGPGAGLVAALMLAVSPWGVIYSRKIWAQNLLPPFVILTVGTGMMGVLENERGGRWLVAHFFLLAVTVQIHYAALVLIPLTLWMLWLGRRNLTRRMTTAIGVVAALAVVGSGALWLMTRERGIDWRAFGQGGLGLTTEALYHFTITVSGNAIHSLAGAEAYQDYLAEVPDIVLLQTLFGWLVILSAAGAGYAAWRRGPGLGRRVRLTLLAWLILPVALFSVTWTPTFPHYLIPLMPAAYILFGAGASAVWRIVRGRSPARGRSAATFIAGLLLVFAAMQTWNTATLYAFLDSHPTPGGFGTPLHYLLDVRNAVLAARPNDVLIVGVSDDPRFDQDAAVWEVLLYDVASVRPLDGRHTAVYSLADGPLALHTAAFNQQAEPALSAPCAGDERRFDLRPGEGYYAVCPAAPNEALIVRAPGPPYATFANGARLVSAAILAGDAPAIRLAWEADGPLPGDYQVFNHLLNAGGQRIGQRDGPAWPGRYWRDGEIVVHDFPLPADIDLPSAEVLRVGMYQLIDGAPQNVDILDAAGNPAGQWVDIPTADILAAADD